MSIGKWDEGYEAGYDAGYEVGISDGWDEALAKVLERSQTYFSVDPASQRLVAALVTKVKEEGR